MSSTQDANIDTPLTLADRFSSLLNLVDEQTKNHSVFMKTVNSELKGLQKELSKVQGKPSKKKKKEPVDGEDVVKRKNVFEVPVPISDELCEFLGLQKGEMCSRQSVTNGITKYVKDNDLQNPENKRYILLDTSDAGRKLNALLLPDQPLTFFNMQRYLKPHYPKVDKGDTTERTDRTDSSTESSESVQDKSKKNSRTKKEPVLPGVVADADTVDDPPLDETDTKKKVRRAVRKA